MFRTIIVGLPGLLIGAAVLPLTACAPSYGDCPEIDGDGLAIVRGTSATEYAAVPSTVTCMVSEALVADIPITVIAADGHPSVELAAATGLVNTANSTTIHDTLPGALATVKAAFAAADDPGINILAGLDLAASSSAHPHIVVVSSGLNTESPLPLQKAGALSADPAELGTAVVSTGVVGDLSGVARLDWFYGSMGTGAQGPLSAGARDQVKAVWDSIVTQAGGSAIQWASQLPQGDEAMPSTEPVEPVVEPPFQDPNFTSADTSPATVTFTAESVRFAPDVATFVDPPAARAALQETATEIIASGRCNVTVTGRTAEITGMNRDSSRRLATDRASAVIAVLVELGVDPACIGAPIGKAGTDSTNYIDNYPNGAFDPIAAALNRVVEVTVAS